MRCDLAASLLHRPAMLFLDEPTIGLDAVSKLAVRDFIRRMNREHGVTVILTTHDMDDIEALCTRVMVISEGRIYSDGTLAALRAGVAAERRLIIDLEHAEDDVYDPEAAVGRREGSRVHLHFDPARVPAAVLISRITARYAVRDFSSKTPPSKRSSRGLYAEVKG